MIYRSGHRYMLRGLHAYFIKLDYMSSICNFRLNPVHVFMAAVSSKVLRFCVRAATGSMTAFGIDDASHAEMVDPEDSI